MVSAPQCSAASKPALIFARRHRFARPETIPSTGGYSTPRQLVLLDWCDSFTASSILSKVEVYFPAVGEAAPSRGMYCMYV